MIFKDNETTAGISNVIWDLGTTAVSSQISSEGTCQGKNAAVASFIEDNYNKVLEQTSQGSGEHLTAMLEVEAQDQAKVIASVRAEMAKEVASDVTTQPERYYNAVMASI